MTNLFNVGAFFVLFRESVETAVILSVLLAFVDRTVVESVKRASLRRQVWIGTLLGVILSIIIGVSLTVTFYVVGKDHFGDAEPLWEGTLQAFAVILLTGLAFRMLYVNTLISKWEQKMRHHMDNLDDQILNGKGLSSELSFSKSYSLAILSFTVVIREGLEAVIFIAGVGQADPVSLIIPSIIGLFAGLVIGYALYKGSYKLNLHLFFKISCWIILFIAAGLAAGAAHEFEEYIYEQRAPDDDESPPESTPVLWDVSDCCSQKTNGFFQIMNALVGWRSVATIATVSVYFSYWFIVGMIAIVLQYKFKLAKDPIITESTNESNDVQTMVDVKI